MVHVGRSQKRGTVKMLAFEPTSASSVIHGNNSTSIITVSTSSSSSSNNSSSSPSPNYINNGDASPSSSSSVNNALRELTIIAEEKESPLKSSLQLKTKNNAKMNQNQNQTNGNNNANVLMSFNEETQNDNRLHLISHGLADSVVESLKLHLLDSQNENTSSESSTIISEETGPPKKKTGIMKITTHSTELHHHHLSRNRNDEAFAIEEEDASALLLLEEQAEAADEFPSSDYPATSSDVAKVGGNGQGKRVSFGNSKGSMVETLVYESPKNESVPSPIGNGNGTAAVSSTTASSSTKSIISSSLPGNEKEKVGGGEEIPTAGSTGGSRPPSRVRVTFFESERPLAVVSSPSESDVLDFDLSTMTLPPGSPGMDPHHPSYNRQISEGWDNPFRPDGDLSKEADQIVELIKEGKPINEENLRSKSPSMNESYSATHASPRGKGANGASANGSGPPDTVSHGLVPPAGQASQVEHVVLKKKKGCCVIQ